MNRLTKNLTITQGTFLTTVLSAMCLTGCNDEDKIERKVTGTRNTRLR